MLPFLIGFLCTVLWTWYLEDQVAGFILGMVTAFGVAYFMGLL